MYSLETLSGFDFELSSHCNAKCPQCPRYDIFGNLQKDLNVVHLDANIIKKLPIQKMKNLKTVNLCGNFGDPLMHPELDEVLTFFQNQQISISTNASLRSKEWWSNLGRNRNIDVMFCIDGIGTEHELYRRNTSYNKVLENAKAFIESGGNARWQFIVFRHNEHQINEAKKLSEDMGFKEIKFIYSDRFDTDNKWKVYGKNIKINFDSGETTFDLQDTNMVDNNYLYDLEKSSHQTTLRESLNAPEGQKYWKTLNQKKGKISCVCSIERKLYIHSDGTVYPCCMLASVQLGKKIEKLMLKRLVRDYKKIDLHHNNLYDILESDVFKKTLPDSFNGDPFQHPVCIEWCNKNTGKAYFNNKAVLDIH